MILLFIRQISPNLPKSPQVSPSLTKSPQSTPNLAKSHQISPSHAKSREISPNIALCQLAVTPDPPAKKSQKILESRITVMIKDRQPNIPLCQLADLPQKIAKIVESRIPRPTQGSTNIVQRP